MERYYSEDRNALAGPLMLGTAASIAVFLSVGVSGGGWGVGLLLGSVIGSAVLLGAAMVQLRQGERRRAATLTTEDFVPATSTSPIHRRVQEIAKWEEDLLDEELLAAEIRAEADRLFGKVQQPRADHSP